MSGPAIRAVLVAALWLAAPAVAHEGHDHDAPAAVPSASSPRRLPDGTVLLPKPSQRLFGLRTVVVERGVQPRALVLPGLVAVDPDSGGRVQATVAGRVEPGPGGLPGVGRRVARGEVLARLRPTVDPLERASRAAQLAELEAARSLAERRAARLRELSDTVPRREIDAAESEAASLGARIRALSDGLARVETLVAPVAGVIARAGVLAGQVVEPREVLFEIADPSRLRIEASGFDLAIAPEIERASVAVGGRAVPLAFVGAGGALREQAVPLVFRGRDAGLAGLAIGQPVPVTVRLRSGAQGVALPAATLARNAANEPVVWVKVAPERFEPRRVRTQPLDAVRVVALEGLDGGERVVTEGAVLLGQVR